jgi:hypothetical protein
LPKAEEAAEDGVADSKRLQGIADKLDFLEAIADYIQSVLNQSSNKS